MIKKYTSFLFEKFSNEALYSTEHQAFWKMLDRYKIETYGTPSYYFEREGTETCINPKTQYEFGVWCDEALLIGICIVNKKWILVKVDPETSESTFYYADAKVFGTPKITKADNICYFDCDENFVKKLIEVSSKTWPQEK